MRRFVENLCGLTVSAKIYLRPSFVDEAAKDQILPPFI